MVSIVIALTGYIRLNLLLGGLLAAAISNMDGIGGKKGWEWIFIIEGLLTVVVAVISFWMVHDFPDTARFLTPEERRAFQTIGFPLLFAD